MGDSVRPDHHGTDRLSGIRPSLEEWYDALRRAYADNLNLQDALLLERAEAPDATYARWLESRKLWPRDLARLRTLSRSLPYQPKLSVIVATYDTAEAHLRSTLDSVFAQTYENWELCIADDASSHPHVRRNCKNMRPEALASKWSFAPKTVTSRAQQTARSKSPKAPSFAYWITTTS